MSLNAHGRSRSTTRLHERHDPKLFEFEPSKLALFMKAISNKCFYYSCSEILRDNWVPIPVPLAKSNKYHDEIKPLHVNEYDKHGTPQVKCKVQKNVLDFQIVAVQCTPGGPARRTNVSKESPNLFSKESDQQLFLSGVRAGEPVDPRSFCIRICYGIRLFHVWSKAHGRDR